MDINYAIAIMQIYPDAQPGIDFRNVFDVDGSQYIAEWNYSQPQPTLEELQTAWSNYLTNPPVTQLSTLDEVRKQQTDLVFTLMTKGVI